MITISNPIIDKHEVKAAAKVLYSRNIAQGNVVHILENNFSKFCGTKFAVAINSGTSALHTALYAADIHTGDEVITTPFTFVATANAILMVGALPVFVDIDPITYNIDPQEIEKAVTKKTKAIIVVNLYGQPADFGAITKIAKKFKLVVIEDAAQSVNAVYKGRKSGNLADLSCFSFYATKNITCGEGGMITTNNKSYFQKAKQFINHGQKTNGIYEYVDIGLNLRMTDIEAAILLEQLKKVDWITKQRQEYAKIYNKAFKNITGIEIPYISSYTNHVFHQYTIRITKDFPLSRNQLIAYLQNKGIQTRVYYPKLLYKYPHLKKSIHKECRSAIKASNEVLSLPIHPALTKKEVNFIIETISSI